jgi:hypothetical protein
VPELPYIPLLNVLEEPVIFVLLMGRVWQRALKQLAAPSVASLARNVLVVFVVWWANGMLLRTLAMTRESAGRLTRCGIRRSSRRRWRLRGRLGHWSA